MLASSKPLFAVILGRCGIFAVAVLALAAIPTGAYASSHVHVTNPGALGTLAPLAATTNVSNQLPMNPAVKRHTSFFTSKPAWKWSRTYRRPLPVRYLYVCKPGPQCDMGAAYESFQTWGNLAPTMLSDCTFAAAANWEQIVLGVHADPSVVESEFAEAGGTAQGLPLNALLSYWHRHGIAGVHLDWISNSLSTYAANVENGVRYYRAMIVALWFREGEYFGLYKAPAGGHMVVVMGFTPEGPLVVSWGGVIQMSWEQWNDEVEGMWGIAAS